MKILGIEIKTFFFINNSLIRNKDLQKVGDTVIGTHFIDLSSISSDGEKVEELIIIATIIICE